MQNFIYRGKRNSGHLIYEKNKKQSGRNICKVYYMQFLQQLLSLEWKFGSFERERKKVILVLLS